MNHSASAAIGAAAGSLAERTTRSRPSPPIPARRSQSRATSAGPRASRPSGSGMITKSFSVPWPLTNGMPSAGETGALLTLPMVLTRVAQPRSWTTRQTARPKAVQTIRV